MYVKRVGRVLQALLSSLNDATFTPVSAIDNPVVAAEQASDIDGTIRVMEMQGHLEVTTDENGAKSLRLSPSGVELFAAMGKAGS